MSGGMEPCVFCGGSDLLCRPARGWLETNVECNACGAIGPDGRPDDEGDAIRKWNVRVVGGSVVDPNADLLARAEADRRKWQANHDTWKARAEAAEAALKAARRDALEEAAVKVDEGRSVLLKMQSGHMTNADAAKCFELCSKAIRALKKKREPNDEN